MLLNWYTLDSCFLTSVFHVRSQFGFFAVCLSAFLLVIVLEFFRRLQRDFDRYLLIKHAASKDESYSAPRDMEEKLLPTSKDKSTSMGHNVLMLETNAMIEQLARGLIHMVQFAVSYCIMLLFMYSNGFIIISILLGATVGFAMFTRDTLYSREGMGESAVEKVERCCG